jgi:hypothetical protein
MKAGARGTKNLKETDMKKLLAFIIISIAMISCYDNYIYDFTYTGVYFPYQQDVRTFVVGEGMKIDVGVTMGGVRKNTIDRTVSFTFDNTLITPARLNSMKTASLAYIKAAATPVTTLYRLPGTYFTITDSTKMIIKSGQHMGAVTIRPDSLLFLRDSLRTMYSTFALPFYITAAPTIDSIIEPRRTNIVGLKFENMLFGNYWHGGQAIVNRPGKSDTTIKYYTAIPGPEAKVWILTTKGPKTVYVNGYADQVTGRKEMTLTLDNRNIVNLTVQNNTVAAGLSTYAFASDGNNYFYKAKLLQDRKIYLKYSYLNTGNGWTYHCTDTLTFRNRIRDGVNEWQDENPDHYLK